MWRRVRRVKVKGLGFKGLFKKLFLQGCYKDPLFRTFELGWFTVWEFPNIRVPPSLQRALGVGLGAKKSFGARCTINIIRNPQKSIGNY